MTGKTQPDKKPAQAQSDSKKVAAPANRMVRPDARSGYVTR